MTAPSISRKTLAAIVPFCVLLAVILFVLISNPLYDRRSSRKVAVFAGLADLSGNPRGLNEIQGSWQFWWNRFVVDFETGATAASPAEAASGTNAANGVVPVNPGYANLPGSWQAAGITEHFGYATYGLRVIGLDPHEIYAFRIGHTLSSCAILVNGKQALAVGKPGASPSSEVPAWRSAYARFTPRDDGSADILLQISNYHDRSGGTNASLIIGESSLMYRMADSQAMTEGFIFAMLSIMGLFFLALYLFRRKDVPFLWFSGLCLVVGFRTLCYDGFLLLDLAPGLSWPVFFRLGVLTFPLIMIFFFGFLGTVFDGFVKPILFRLIVAAFSLFAAIAVLAPEFVSSILLIPFQIVALVCALYGLSVIARACARQLEGSVWVLCGFTIAICSFVYDVLVSLWIVSGFSLGHLGMSICLFCLALLVIERYTTSYAKAQQLSGQLRRINASLQRFVPAEFLAFLGKASIAEVQPGDCAELDMAIFSADIRSFTAIAERMKPDDVFSFLNGYLELVGPIIRKNGGFIAKYEGDGFFALFPSGPDMAIRAAIQMQSAIAKRNRDDPEKTPVMVGIGIDCGSLALGTIGDESRLDGAIISRCVKCAGRFESTTKQFNSRILINEAVYAGLSNPLAYFIRPVDRINAGEQASFLFEVYANDSDTMRDLKWRTQSDLEHALYAWFSGHYDEARIFLEKVLQFYPDDPVASHYARRLEG